MCELIIENGILIDDVKSMMDELNELTNRTIKDVEIIKKFVCSEKNTKFYVDEKLKASVNQDTGSMYLWLDTGFCDIRNRPIFISLLRTCGEYIGHFVGTAQRLMENVREYFPRNRKYIKENFSKFLKKYDAKSNERDTVHILDEETYILTKVNAEELNEGVISKKLKNLNVMWEPEESSDEEPEQEIVEDTLSAFEEELTIGLLLEKLEELEHLNRELMQIVETRTMQSDEEIRKLKEKVKEYQEVIVQIRLFNEAEQINEESEEKSDNNLGHDLLGKNKQILVLGDTQIGIDKMQGIAKKDYGFGKHDFDFITDYDKVVHAAKRIQNSDRYAAIIFGCCPHKVKNTNWSSIIEQFKNCMKDIVTVDARTQSGQLKITKESYRKALDVICNNLYLSPLVV